MTREAIKTLFHPFAADMLPLPQADDKILFLGAEIGPALPEGFEGTIDAVQGLRPLYRVLEAAGKSPSPVITGETYDMALILCSKHRGEIENRVADALERVNTGGFIVVAGSKDEGIATLRKTLQKLGLTVESTPKYHGIALWFACPENADDYIAKLRHPEVTVEGRFTAAPGMFSHDEIDGGSELLASRLPTDFDGNAADFGAGWGYLSIALAEKSPRTARIDLFEADHAALEFAKTNLLENCPKQTARFFWQDLVNEAPKEKYDMIIMNPPFHSGQSTEVSLGQAFIKQVAGALRNGGKLYLVANRGLPYETALAEHFRTSSELCRNARFKVLIAQK